MARKRKASLVSGMAEHKGSKRVRTAEDTSQSVVTAAQEPPTQVDTTKRTPIPGRQRRQGVASTNRTSKLNRVSGSTRRNVTLNGHKVNFGLGTGGFEGVSKSQNSKAKEEELWVTRKVGFAYLLKRALGTFVARGCNSLTLRAMGAAIPVALTLALAIPDHLPCGPAGVEQTVQTGSTDCWDEILPLGEDGEEDEEKDPAYQTRVKSTVAVRLALKNTSGDSGKK